MEIHHRFLFSYECTLLAFIRQLVDREKLRIMPYSATAHYICRPNTTIRNGIQWKEKQHFTQIIASSMMHHNRLTNLQRKRKKQYLSHVLTGVLERWRTEQGDRGRCRSKGRAMPIGGCRRERAAGMGRTQNGIRGIQVEPKTELGLL